MVIEVFELKMTYNHSLLCIGRPAFFGCLHQVVSILDEPCQGSGSYGEGKNVRVDFIGGSRRHLRLFGSDGVHWGSATIAFDTYVGILDDTGLTFRYICQSNLSRVRRVGLIVAKAHQGSFGIFLVIGVKVLFILNNRRSSAQLFKV